MNELIKRQLDVLRGEFPKAEAIDRSDGTALVVIPEFPLPTGWSARTTTIRFLAPVQYPIAQPDCFWADRELLLEGHRTPQSTNISEVPGPLCSHPSGPYLWFSWHVQGWDPNRSSLKSYARVISNRFDQRQ